jgi:hypothetical protein
MSYCPISKSKVTAKMKSSKDFHEVENLRRYLISGTLALFEKQGKKTKCRRIYSKSTLVCDFESYVEARLTNYAIKAYADCLVCEIPKGIELQLTPTPENMAKVDLEVEPTGSFAKLGMAQHPLAATRGAVRKTATDLSRFRPDQNQGHLRHPQPARKNPPPPSGKKLSTPSPSIKNLFFLPSCMVRHPHAFLKIQLTSNL